MRKLSILVGALTLTGSLFAQDLTSKKGENYLPEQGDWGLSIDATPFLAYFGNFIGGNGMNVAPTYNFLHGSNAIIGKYYVEEKMAYRGGLNIMMMSMTENALVAKVGSTTNEQVTDTKKTSGFGMYLSGGLEWRKGNTRLQGYYGGELGLGFGGGSKETYTYGNSYDFTNNPTQSHGVDGATDVLETKTAGGLMFGLRGFVGTEYFILPKISLGGEFGWGLGLMTNGESTQTVKQVNGAGNGLEDKTNVTSSKGSNFMLGTDNMNSVFGPSGTIRIAFHF